MWDDYQYVLDNPLIRSINLSKIFSAYVVGSYNPVTITAYAAEYFFFNLNAGGYHFVNLFFHLLNTSLVFFLVFLLSNKTTVAFIASLLFGIHPLHAESVAWISELKDLLYTFFFLAALICYLKYLSRSKRKYYVFTLLFFLLSLLSKAMAASLPIVLLLLDYLQGRNASTKTWLEKLPFFVAAIAAGIVAIFAQQSATPEGTEIFPLIQRTVFAAYSFLIYLFKLLVPFQLSAYYSYPVHPGESIPALYYLCFVLLLVFAVLVFYSLRVSRKIFFGTAFFAVTVLLVLQLIPFGIVIMADRFAYVPSIGIFYLAGEGFCWLWKNKSVAWIKNSAVLLLSVTVIFYSTKTYARCRIWKNNGTLWTDVINNHPNVAFAYFNRGTFLLEQKNYEQAENDFSKTIELKPDYFYAYVNRGNLMARRKNFREAQNDYNAAIKIDPYSAIAYYVRGLNEFYVGAKSNACADFMHAANLGYQPAAQAYSKISCH